MGENNKVENFETVSVAETTMGTYTNQSSNMKQSPNPREWFATLSDDDRIVALGFVDEHFLAALSRGVTLPLSVPGPQNTVTDRHSAKVAVDWMSEITPAFLNMPEPADLCLIDQQAIDTENQFKSALLPEIDVAKGTSVLFVDPISKPEYTDETIKSENDAGTTLGENAESMEPAMRDSDVFRIQEGENVIHTNNETRTSDGDSSVDQNVTKNGNDQPIVHEESSLHGRSDAVLEETNPKNDANHDKITAFVNSVCVISPSVLQFVGSDLLSEIDAPPVLSLHPSFLSQKNGQDALAALDEIMPNGKFLSGPVHKTWKDAVQSLLGDDVESAASVPLYMLLLWRFQFAVLEYYHLSLEKISPVNTSSWPQDSTVLISNEEAIDEAPANEFQNDNVQESAIEAAEGIPTSPMNDETRRDTTEIQKVSEADIIRTKAFTQRVHDSRQLIEMLPSLWKQIGLIDSKDRVETFFFDIATFLEASSNHIIASTLKQTDEFIDQQIIPHKHAVVADVDRSEVTGSSRQTTDNIPATEERMPMGDDANTNKNEIEEVIGGSPYPTSIGSGTGTANKKNPKKKKRRKRRKGSTSIKTSKEDERRMEVIVEQSYPVVETVEESTPILKVPPEEKQMSIENKNEIVDVVPAFTSGLSPSVCSDKSVDDDTVDTADESGLTKQDGGKGDEDTSEKPRLSEMERVAPSLSINDSTDQEKSRITDETADAGVQVEDDNQDQWETVEVRSRGNRKKMNERTNGRFSSLQSHNGNGSKRKTPRNPETRKRTAKRKMVREILFSVLDSVDEQIRRRKQTIEPSPRPVTNAWGTSMTRSTKSAISTAKDNDGTKTQQQGGQKKEGTTMRDILMGKQNANSIKVSNPQQGSQRGQWERGRQRGNMEGTKKGRDKHSIVSPTADQNTAPTLPETLSAVSTASAFTETPYTRKNLPPGLARSISSSEESIEAIKPPNTSRPVINEVAHSPPLPTLLSPGNANSATSSVASSLDAPHTAHHNHHSSYPGSDNDVGYHLLRVCDRLTRDIGQFMRRREEALRVRRHERGLVLAALQDSLTTIWPTECKVEMYGSCATDLDLPSSDLDVVVRGLDHAEHVRMLPEKAILEDNNLETSQNGKVDTCTKIKGKGSLDKGRNTSSSRGGTVKTQHHGLYSHMGTNAERVVTLAVELERQPWAVHVKAIPTATVPVIKILADPARLQGKTIGNEEWLVHQVQGGQTPMNTSKHSTHADPRSQYPGSQVPLPWRGADVVNGLLKVDITFEGPEHGGIGSTQFSTRVVEEFSKESGLPPDSTAAVQVLMVLKELLAQRRLNEPFSGGLSSYALLLLVISVVRERAIIRKELERVEKQRKLVAAGGGNAVLTSETDILDGALEENQIYPTTENPYSVSQRTEIDNGDNTRSKTGRPDGEMIIGQVGLTGYQEKLDSSTTRTNEPVGELKSIRGNSGHDGTASKSGGSTSSSWASIARKTSQPLLKKASQDSTQSTASSDSKNLHLKKAGSFAEVVTKGSTISPGTQEERDISTKIPDSGKDMNNSSVGRGSTTMERPGALSQEKRQTTPFPVGASTSEPNIQTSYAGSVPTKQTISSVADESGSFFPQSFHDVIEVLCSGETTPGKLLMHFLLFYGQHFDSHSTAIDYSNTHKRDPNSNGGYAVSSPYMQRRSTGSYDPVTGMLTVDPIVVYDPLEGAELNNVARSCFAWSSIRWVFAQSYMTLSSAVEMSAGHLPGQSSSRGTSGGMATNEAHRTGQEGGGWGVPYGHDESGNIIFDPSSPLLELLLSF